ncbi:amidohydrolase [Streptomyces sp. CSDS2]|uniref:amidohydrolase n=1 Tax=Streptomyces sp. CSDS2 TaxID=3055051 RepID=UPI0025B06915|nr:amidohydrolase [Streptomyces sp. CSDS2]MDN3258717.1 amidohydrolase [Streptomyces sp. CSDS2]
MIPPLPPTPPETGLSRGLAAHLPHWEEVYRDLHAHPELAFQERRTAAAVVRELADIGGWETTEQIGRTGVVSVLRNGAGPVVWLRADMDALPVREETGLPYASVEPGLMHACGHDVHVAALLGVCRQLAAHPGAWSGTVVAVFQPAEEVGHGARAMLDDGVLDRFPRPEVVLGQHVGPLPAGVVTTRPGPLMAAADSLRVTLYGAGAHASAPHLAVDPIVMAAAVVLRLQTLSARLAPLSPSPLLTVGALHSGTVANVIPHTAELLCSLRTFDTQTRDQVLAGIRRVVDAEADAQGATRTPDITTYDSFPLTVNDPAATERVLAAVGDAGALGHTLPAPLSASEDFGRFAAAAGCPSVFFHFGGADPGDFDEAAVAALERGTLPPGTATNHSPHYAPSDRHAVAAGVRHLLAAAASWLAPRTGRTAA